MYRALYRAYWRMAHWRMAPNIGLRFKETAGSPSSAGKNSVLKRPKGSFES